jgi:hypothetical protein
MTEIRTVARGLASSPTCCARVETFGVPPAGGHRGFWTAGVTVRALAAIATQIRPASVAQLGAGDEQAIERSHRDAMARPGYRAKGGR